MARKSCLKSALAIVVLLLLTYTSATVHAKTIYVDDDANGANDGSSWTDAYKYLQDALIAAVNGDEIRIAQGIYKPDQGAGITPGDRTASFQLINGVTIKGGYAGAGHPDPDIRNVELYETILSGDLTVNDDPDNRNTWDENSHVILTASNTNQTAVLDGVTATASRGGLPSAGLYNLTSSPTVIDCIFSRNSTTGVFNDYYSAPTFVNCTFRENMERCGMRNERSNPTLMGCIFIDNSSGNMRGGGMYNYYSDPTLINCEFIGNFAGREGAYSLYGGGGGMYIDSSDPMLFGCTFTGNCSVNNKGGAIRNLDGDPILINCSFSGNSASNNEGGGIYDDFGTTILVNCILWGNTDENGSGQSSQICFKVGSPTVNYCCIQGWTGQWGGVGNIGDDPMFMDAEGTDNVIGTQDDNLRLWPGSPCADSGDNLAVPTAVLTDLDGGPRFADDPHAPDKGNGAPPIVDIGAYEGPKQGFLVSTKSIIIPEGGTAAFTVSLAMDPLGMVQVTVAHVSGDIDIKVESGTSLNFDSSDYSQPKTVTLAAAEDWDSFYGTATIQVSAAGFATYSVIANEGDNEPAPNVFHVDGTNGDDNSDGLTKETAFATIQKGVDTAQRDGDIINVADGIYASEGWQNNPVIDFRGKAITVRSENGPENCILYRGDYVVSFQSGETPASVLSGFTVTGADPGAGICCWNSSPTIMNNIIICNWSEYGLGAVLLHNSQAVVTNNLIAGNDVYGPCAGIVVCHGSSVTIANNTIVSNPPNNWSDASGAVYCTEDATAKVTNLISWDNGNYDLYGCTATYSCLEHEHPGEGNIYENPMFVSLGDWDDYYYIWVDFDFHLLPGSPCIDAGDPNYIAGPNETDLDGKPRVIAGRIDMGAYEFLSQMILYVDTDATGANDGSSWADAFNYLQDALTTAYYGDEIRVAQGIYKPDQGAGIAPGDREATFQLINGVTIKGGYAGIGTPDPDARHINLYETILSGDLNGDDGPNFSNNEENSYHVVTGSGTYQTAILDGFTITAGKANGSWLLYQDDGGGLCNYAGSPTIGNCTFTGNWAGWYGGGIYNESSSPTLFNCTIRYNVARGSGSGMCNREGSNPIVTNCTFSFNVGLSYHDSLGVGMYNYKSNPILSNCAFTGNSGSFGAGMCNYYSDPKLTSCTFIANKVHAGGGGMANLESSPTLINCTFSGNWSDWYGVGGMDNCCGSTPILTNCILWNDMPGEISGPTVVTYSNVQGGWPGTGNIDAEPSFVSPGYWDTNDTPDKPWDDFWIDGDYHLLPGSPCIDTGDPNYIAEPNETDLNGKPRVLDGDNDGFAVVDLGAYEYRFTISAEARIAPQTINLASKGNWITCYIWLPDEYNVADIDPNSVLLEGQIQSEQFLVDEQQQVATARFNREDVQPVLEVGEINLKITGRLTDGTVFEAKDTIKVIDKAVKN